MRLVTLNLLLALTVIALTAHAGSQGPNRLADGTLVPEGADFVAPSPAAGHLPMVRYPKQLAIAGIKGRFEADIVVSPSGDVLDITVKQRVHRQLDQGIVKLLRQVPFQPATLDGKPVAAVYRASYDFSIE